MRKFILIISNKQVLYLYLDSEGLHEQEKLDLENNLKKIFLDNLHSKIIRNIVMEDKGLKYNRSSKLDISYYFKLLSGMLK